MNLSPTPSPTGSTSSLLHTHTQHTHTQHTHTQNMYVVPPESPLHRLPKVDFNYTYQQPVATAHPAMQQPSPLQVRILVTALNNTKSNDRLVLSNGYQIAMTAAHAASKWNGGRSHKLESIKNVVKTSKEPELVTASAYEVARHWSCYDGNRFYQSHRIIERAIGRTLDPTLAMKYNDSCRTMMWMAMAEVAKGIRQGSTVDDGVLTCDLEDVLKALRTIGAYLGTYGRAVAWPANMDAQTKDAIQTVIREVSAFSFEQSFVGGMSKARCTEYTGMKNAIVQRCRDIEATYSATPSNQVQSS
jgi:hypothetical protein